jgi:hypothetical protein
MDVLTHVFSLVCGQQRCFVVDGAPLPVCERCLGLYVGGLLTAIWLIAFRVWRNGLPGRTVVAAEAVALGCAMLAGLHVIDLGPTWRLLCGLWTGHVAVLWLVGGASELRALSRPGCVGATLWPRRAQLAALAILPGLAVFARCFVALPPVGWQFWSAAATLGALSLLVAVSTGLISAGFWLRSVRQRRQAAV